MDGHRLRSRAMGGVAVLVLGVGLGAAAHAGGARFVTTRLGGGPVGILVDGLGIQLAVLGVACLAGLVVAAGLVLVGPRPWAMLGSVGARRRLARGRCHACGYLRVGAGTECPECGRRNWIAAGSGAAFGAAGDPPPRQIFTRVMDRASAAVGGWGPLLVVVGWTIGAGGLHLAMEADERAFLRDVATAREERMRSVERERRTPPFGVFTWRVGGEPRNDR
ncbi:MAG: hypothetical protein AB8G96_05200 [Phycisphaerales bacterium]